MYSFQTTLKCFSPRKIYHLKEKIQPCFVKAMILHSQKRVFQMRNWAKVNDCSLVKSLKENLCSLLLANYLITRSLTSKAIWQNLESQELQSFS